LPSLKIRTAHLFWDP